MSFLNPILLLGLLAIAVPVVIHLRNRRRVERVRWGAMRFLRVAVERNEKRMRAEDWLLLLVRCAVVGLLALGMARPSCREAGGGGWGQGRVVGVMVLDVSGSMGASDGVRVRLELAKEAAERVVRELPGGSRMAVWTTSGGGVRKLIEEPTADLSLVRRVIGEVGLTDGSTRLEGAVGEALRVLGGGSGGAGGAGGSGGGGGKEKGRREVYVVTDGQRAGTDYGAMNAAMAAAKEKSGVETTVVLVGRELGGNVGVSEVRAAAATGVVTVGRPVRYAVTVTNYGAAEVRDVRVVLRVGVEGGVGRMPAPVDEGVIESIGPGASKGISLFGRFGSVGMHAVRAEVVGASGIGGDGAYTADDERTVVTRVVERVRVLLVDGEPGREARDGQGFYVRQALGASGGGEDGFVKVDVVGGAEFDGGRLEEYDAVVLAGVRDVSGAVADGLMRFVEQGGGMVFFPGAGTQVEAINRELFVRRGLLPAELGGVRGGGGLGGDAELSGAGSGVNGAGGVGSVTLGGRDTGHELVAEWREKGAELGGVTFYRWLELREAGGAGGVRGERAGSGAGGVGDVGRVVLRYSDGSAAVMEKRVGRGRVVEFSSTATTQWNDLPIRPGVFVPLIYKVLGAVVGEGADEALRVRVGGEWVYRAGAEWIGREVEIRGPGVGGAGVGEVSEGRVELVEGEGRVVFGGTDRAGVYEVRGRKAGGGGGNGTGGEGEAIRFAAVREGSESETGLMSVAQRGVMAGSARVVEYESGGAGGGAALAGAVSARGGMELWWLVVGAVMVLAGMETWMAWRFSRAK